MIKVEDIKTLTTQQFVSLKTQLAVAVERNQAVILETINALGDEGTAIFREIADRGGSTMKFRNPKNPKQVWSGRGRHPAWVKRHLTAGKKLSDLRA